MNNFIIFKCLSFIVSLFKASLAVIVIGLVGLDYFLCRDIRDYLKVYIIIRVRPNPVEAIYSESIATALF